MWDPTKRRDDVVHELECSRDEHGRAQATVTLRPWSTRERLAFQDAGSAGLTVTVDEETGTSLRRVRMSVVQLAHVRLTVVACTGFPDIGGRPFSFQDDEHVLALDEDVFREVYDAATALQPVMSDVKRPQDRKAPVDAAAADDFATDDTDPSPTR